MALRQGNERGSIVFSECQWVYRFSVLVVLDDWFDIDLLLGIGLGRLGFNLTLCLI